ncbi:MAG: membrane protein insertion efficiency factor YidD, partial [Planctomycetota bacterium]
PRGLEAGPAPDPDRPPRPTPRPRAGDRPPGPGAREEGKRAGAARAVMRALVLLLLRFYKGAISPWLPAACRSRPTCREYARTAVERHGALRGGWLTLCRLLRCRPGGGGGEDPVP